MLALRCNKNFGESCGRSFSESCSRGRDAWNFFAPLGLYDPTAGTPHCPPGKARLAPPRNSGAGREVRGGSGKKGNWRWGKKLTHQTATASRARLPPGATGQCCLCAPPARFRSPHTPSKTPLERERRSHAVLPRGAARFVDERQECDQQQIHCHVSTGCKNEDE